MAAIAIGLVAGVACYGGVMLKGRFGYDDALDAFGVHGLGGALGAPALPASSPPRRSTRPAPMGSCAAVAASMC